MTAGVIWEILLISYAGHILFVTKIEWLTGETFSEISLMSMPSNGTCEKTGDHMRGFYKISQISWTGFMNPQIIHEKLGNFANF